MMGEIEIDQHTAVAEEARPGVIQRSLDSTSYIIYLRPHKR